MMDLNTEGKGELIKYIVSTNKISMPKKMVITCSREDAEKIAKQLGATLLGLDINNPCSRDNRMKAAKQLKWSRAVLNNSIKSLKDKNCLLYTSPSPRD